jgi:hypothetical protein
MGARSPPQPGSGWWLDLDLIGLRDLAFLPRLLRLSEVDVSFELA